MTTTFHRALAASLAFGIGAGELARRKTFDEALDEARDIARVHGCRAFVYRRADGSLVASQLEPELLPAGPGAERIACVSVLRHLPEAVDRP